MQTRPEKGNAPEVAATEASGEVSQTTKKGTIMSNFTSALTIGETSVRQVGGLFSLNDLHKAAGSEAKHEPNQFTRLDQTQALIAEIKSADSRNCIETRRGANGGTYACRELVIAYAAWISAAFHLKVIRVFLAVAAPQPTPYTVQPSDTLNESQQIALRAMLESNVKRLPHAKQAGAMIKGWSKLKAHFGVPYRQIPAGEFEEALSIIARHVSEWELVDEAPKASQEPTMPELVEKMVEWVNAPNGYPVHLFVPVYEAIHARLQRGMEVPRIIDATDAPAMAQARKVAMDYFADYRAAVKCGKSLAEMDAIPSAALQGMIADAIMRQRMLISFDQGTGRMGCTVVPGDASVFSFATGNYTDLINGIPMQRLPELADSLNRRVASHLGAFSERLNRA